MTLEELNKLEDKTLIVIKGKSLYGEQYYMCCRLRKDLMCISEKGLLWGGSLYPLNWVYIATQDDYLKLITKESKRFEQTLDSYKQAYELAKKQGGK